MNERLSETRGKGEILFSKSGYSGSFFCVFGFMIRDPGILENCFQKYESFVVCFFIIEKK